MQLQLLKTNPKKRVDDSIDHPPKHKKNVSNITIMVSLTIFLLVMFTSRYFLTPRNLQYDVGPTTKEGATYTAVSWTWSKKQQMMEIIVSIGGNYENYDSATANIEYLTASTTKRGKGEIKMLTNDTVVVTVTGVPRDMYQSKLTLSMVKDGSTQTLIFYDNRDQVLYGMIEDDLTDTDYRIKSKEGEVNRYNSLIQTAFAKIEANDTEKKDITEQIKKIREQAPYMTEKQLADAEQNITALKSKQGTLTKTNAGIRVEVGEYQERIKLLEQQIEDLRGTENEE